MKAKVMQPMFQLPPMPAHLLQDSVRLPLNYQPETWAMDLVEEWGYTKQLAAADAYPTLSVLLGGPSGVGKSTAARWIASKLGLPVFSLLLSGTIDSYMGNTGKAISSALSFASTVPGVLILDELDAISASREAKHQDVGEIWRVTNTFIQCLDHFHAEVRPSLLIGTTNMVDDIDSAIRRRFELEVLMLLPDRAGLSAVAGFDIPEHVRVSYADMMRFVLQAKRCSVVKGENYRHALLRLLGDPTPGPSPAKT